MRRVLTYTPRRSKMAKNTYDYPIYLFNEGTNFESYKFFCPCYVQKDGKKFWRFRVWAPNAKSVSVVGDYNDWDRTPPTYGWPKLR